MRMDGDDRIGVQRCQQSNGSCIRHLIYQTFQTFVNIFHCGIVFPIGLFFYFRIWAFRIRLNKDMERIIKTNEDVIGIIERDQNK